jgi:DNA processing protein
VRERPSSPDERTDALALALAPRVGPRHYLERTAGFASAAQAFGATVDSRSQGRLRDEALRMVDDGARCGARLILVGDADYPPQLLHLSDPPPFLFVIGDLALTERPCVAIVGTRQATPYGERATTIVAGGAAASGACIVSGMARGIDAAAHRAALARRGATIAVLGTGVDVAYPVAHRDLHRTIGERGLLVSEFACGARPEPGSFPRRNRIIAALARLTVVIEAGERSGARITAEHAADLGRDVGAVPGAIDSPQSAGSNLLIRDGVHTILAPADVLALLGLAGRTGGGRRAHPSLSGDEHAIWGALVEGAAPMEVLVERAGLPPSRALAAVTALELAGLVEASPIGELRRRGG